MSTNELLEIVKNRGLKIVLVDGRPILKRPGDNDAVTDKLLNVLKLHRERIISMLAKESHDH